MADEQFHAAGGIVDVPDGEAAVPMVATPADFHGTPWAPRSAGTATRAAHRRSARRTRGAPQALIRPANLYKFPRSVTLSGEPHHPVGPYGEAVTAHDKRPGHAEVPIRGKRNGWMVTRTFDISDTGDEATQAHLVQMQRVCDTDSTSLPRAPVDAVQAAGGWLYDRVMAGWEVTVLLPDGCDPRPLRILGGQRWISIHVPTRSASQALAVSAELFTADARRSRRGAQGPGQPADRSRVVG